MLLDGAPFPGPAPRPTVLTTSGPRSGSFPALIPGYYGFGGATNEGAGQTIAIVVPYDYPTANLTADITLFDSTFGLQAFGGAGNPTLAKYDQNGTFSYPAAQAPMDVTLNMTWEEQAAMDVEWAHAAAPGANIALVEAADNTIGNVMTAVQTAAGLPRGLCG